LAALAVGLFAATALCGANYQQGRQCLDADLEQCWCCLMTIPGLALFYGGLVRSKNMLSVLMQVSTPYAS